MSVLPASQQCSIYFGTPFIRESLPAQHSGDAELLPSPRYLGQRTAAAHYWLAAIHEQATGDHGKATEHRRRAEKLSAGTQTER